MQFLASYSMRFLYIVSILYLTTENITAKEKSTVQNYSVIAMEDSIIVIPVSIPSGHIQIQNLQGLEKINAYINGESTDAPILEDFTQLDINGVTAENIKEINAFLKENAVNGIETKENLQELVSTGIEKISEAAIVNYAKGITQSVPSDEDYRHINIRCVSKDNVDMINQALREETYYDVKDRYFIQQSVYSAVGAENIILDNDAFDPDWVIMLATTMGLEHTCEIHTLGILLTGRDMNRKQSMSYSAITHYYKHPEIPIGLNVRQSMRSYYLDATSNNPKHINYRGGYHSIDEFSSHQCLDYEICPGMNESNGVICSVLSQVKGKVSWVIGGHMHNIANFLKETQQCNGKELFTQKVKQVVIATGWTSRTSGEPEMNFSEGTTSPNSASDATKYFFANRPLNVPVIIASIPNSRTDEPRVGDIFTRDAYQDSPMAYILSVPRYGVYGDHGLSDTEALLYAAREGKTKSGTEYALRVETCFHVKQSGAVTIGSGCGRPDYYLEMTRSDYAQILESEVYHLLNFKP